MEVDISQLRLNYTKGGIEKVDLNPDPIKQFSEWMEVAVNAGIVEPNAMTLATSNASGVVSSRTVLLKGLDTGFCFYSNYRSQKAQDIEQNSNVALTFLWKELERQVNVQGVAKKLTESESNAYFQSRPYASQIGAWVSDNQSAEIPDRAELQAKEIALRQQFPEGEVPLPSFWGGFRIVPESLEFWQGREGRLHDRLRFVKAEGDTWDLVRLSP